MYIQYLCIHVNILAMRVLLFHTLSVLKLVGELYPTRRTITAPRLQKTTPTHLPSTAPTLILSQSLDDYDNCLNLFGDIARGSIKKRDPLLYQLIKTFLTAVNLVFQTLKTNPAPENPKPLLELFKQSELLKAHLKKTQVAVTIPTTVRLHSLRKEIVRKIDMLNSFIRLATERAYDALMTLQVIHDVEKLYCEKFSNLMAVNTDASASSNTTIDAKSNSEFLANFHTEIYRYTKQAHENLLQKYPTLLKMLMTPSLSVSITKKQYAVQLGHELIARSKKIYKLIELTQMHNGRVIYFFHQNRDPAIHLGEGQCIGIVTERGLSLRNAPPTDRGKANDSFLSYIDFLIQLETKKRPAKLLATYAWLGEKVINKRTLLCHLLFGKLFRDEKVASIPYPNIKCEGRSIANAALTLLKQVDGSKEPVSVIGVTLYKVNNNDSKKKIEPHFQGIFKITLPSKETVYRFVDGTSGEYEFDHEADLSKWLQEYLQITGNAHFDTFTLHPLNKALNDHRTLTFDRTLFQLLKEQCQEQVSTPEFKTNMPKPVIQQKIFLMDYKIRPKSVTTPRAAATPSTATATAVAPKATLSVFKSNQKKLPKHA